jgi:dihydroorotase-like cyclic amidohydrolase
MIDLGLFVSESYSHSAQQLAAVLARLGDVGIEGGLLHQNSSGSIQDLVHGFAPALASSQLGLSEIQISQVRFVTHRARVSDKPAQLSALMAKCADMGALLLVHSPFAEAESASVALAPRAGHRLVNLSLAKGLLQFMADEAQYWGCRLHIHSISSAAELQMLAPYRQQGMVTTSVPLHLLVDLDDNYGYGFAGRLWPASMSSAETESLVEAVIAGGADALTSHVHLFSEALELDPLAAEPGADVRLHMPEWQKRVQATLGTERWTTLTETNPRAILAN